MAVQSARNRAEFLLDVMSHDLNNMNQGVLTAIEIMLYNSGIPDDASELLQRMQPLVERGAHLIDNVKKITKIDTEPLKLEHRDIAQALFTAVQAVEKSFPGKSMELTTNLQPGDYSVIADEYLIDIFYNLLHNSMKFTQEERVPIEVNVVPSADKFFVVVQVNDYGPGIPDKQNERVLGRFVHKGNGLRGLGVGLALVRRIIEHYNGQIEVEDRVLGDYTKGTTFNIHLRLSSETSSLPFSG